MSNLNSNFISPNDLNVEKQQSSLRQTIKLSNSLTQQMINTGLNSPHTVSHAAGFGATVGQIAPAELSTVKHSSELKNMGMSSNLINVQSS